MWFISNVWQFLFDFPYLLQIHKILTLSKRLLSEQIPSNNLAYTPNVLHAEEKLKKKTNSFPVL